MKTVTFAQDEQERVVSVPDNAVEVRLCPDGSILVILADVSTLEVEDTPSKPESGKMLWAVRNKQTRKVITVESLNKFFERQDPAAWEVLT